MLRRENLQGLYPLSPMQEGMLFHALQDPDSTAYLEQLSFRMNPAPAHAVFAAVWQLLVRRHDILRTVFMPEAGARPLQAVLKDAPPRIRHEDLSALPPAAQDAHRVAWKEADLLAGFDLAAAPPLRLAYFDLGRGQAEIVFTHHHILMDGWCLGILQQEFVTALQALEAGQTPELPPPTPFARYIEWLGACDATAARSFWRDQLAGDAEIASIVRDGVGARHAPADHVITLDAATGERLRAIAIQAGATAATLLHALWGLAIGRMLDREDVVFGSIVANRPEVIPGIEHMLGLFINALPVRVAWEGGVSFRDLLGRLQRQMLARRPHEFLPLTDIQAEAGGRTLFDHVMLVQNYPIERAVEAAGNARIQGVALMEHTHYRLAVSVVPGAEPSFHLAYDPNGLSPAEIAAFERRLRHLAALVAAEPDRALSTLPLTEPGEAIGAAAAPAAPATMAALIAAACRAHSAATALSCEGRTVTYATLDGAANAVAHRLRAALGLQPDDRIGLLAQRSELLPVAMLGIARAGAAYVPIDPAYPPDRIAMLCRDSGCRLVLAVPAPGGALPAASLDAVPEGVPVLVLDAMPDAAASPPAAPRPPDLLYVAYTSGSTGRPKGVMIEHRSVAAFTAVLGETFGLAAGMRILALTTITFDISVLELLCSLAHGMTVVVATDAVAADPDLVLAAIAAERIDVLQAPPSRLQMLLDAADGVVPPGLGTLLVGGEALPPSLAARLAAVPGLASFNVYGPTETTIWSTAQRVTPGPVAIGTPFPGESVALLSRNGRICPRGVVGEIGIGGVGLARGYLGRPDLTAASRIAHPDDPTLVLYRTGDLGRWRHDGTLEVLGRRDDQVKIRGHRIEAGEITAALEACPGVRQAVVRPQAIGSDTELVAYVAADGVSAAGLRAALGRTLPGWMVPGRIIVMVALPLLPSGKVDRNRLPAPGASADAIGAPPRDKLEQRLAVLFGEVLGAPPPDIDGDFFALGGHSLKAAQLLGRLRREFSRDLRLRDLFAAPSVAGLAAALRHAVPAVAHAITVLDDAESYALSPAQRRMWVLERILPQSGAYLLPAAFQVDGDLDAAALQRALAALVARHEALRTVFVEIDGEPRQVVRPPGVVEIEHPADLQAFFAQGFDLENAPPFRVGLVRQAPQRHILAFALHHIAADGQSLAILQRDLGRLYAAPPGRPVPPPRLRYRDVAAWQNALLTDDSSAPDRQFWHGVLGGELPPLELATDHPRPAVADPRGAVLTQSLGLADSNALRRLARQAGATPFMAAASLVAALLSRHGATDIRLGFPVAGRTHPDEQDIVGVFINTLVLRLRPDMNAGYAALLDATRQAVEAALDHQTYPFDRLVDELLVSRDPSRSPVFDVMVTFDERAPGALRLGTLRVTPLVLPANASRFDLTFGFAEAEDGTIALAVEYRQSLFTPARIARLASQLRTVLAAIARAPATPLAALALMDPAEQAGLLAASMGPVIAPAGLMLPDLFAAQVARSPDAVALRCAGMTLRYAELDAQANQLARHLIAQGVGAGDIAAILVDRSPAMIVAMLAVLKAGAAYLPVDPALPTARISLMLADSAAKCLLTDQARAVDAKLTIRLDDPAITALSGAPVNVPVSPDDLAYVIYTSGSTGTPKGAAVYHRGVVNLLQWYVRRLDLTSSDRGLLVSAIGFDLTQKNIFAPLIVGASLRIPAERHFDPDALVAAIHADGVTWINGTPSAFYPLVDQQAAQDFARLASLRWIVLGGEPIQMSKLRPFLTSAACRAQILNSYGPTECTDIATAWVLDAAADAIPLGQPIDNVQVVLLEGHRQWVPQGNVGTLWISGMGVGAGYINNAGLNAAAFADLDFGSGVQRFYCTGDLARMRADGVLLFLGRADHQVKIRGFRIEPGEIEAVLQRQFGAAIAQLAVVARTVDGEQRLVAYLAPRAGAALPDTPALREAVAAHLPGYMVPSAFVALPALPLTPNGKLDTRALPDPPRAEAAALRPPRGPVETALHAIWVQVLGTESIGRHDNFFERGGHSLKAVRLVALVRAHMGAALALSSVFTAPTIADQAALLGQADGAMPPPPMVRAPPQADYPLTPAQRRLWLLAQTEAKSAYGLAAAFLIEGALDIAALGAAFADLAARHDILRTVFPVIGGVPRQRVQPPGAPVLRVAACVPTDAALALCRDAAALPFDLESPLFRATLWPLDQAGATRHALLIALHHIIGDAGSLDIIMRDLVALYGHRLGLAAKLPELPWQAGDIALHQDRAGDGAAGSRQYWLEKLGGELPVLDLPTDRPRPARRGWLGRTLALPLDATRAAALEAVAAQAGVSLYVLLVALTKTVLHRHTGQTDIILGAAITGRDDAALDGQIGFYVETVALRDPVWPDAPFADLLASVRQTVDEAVAHRRFPFDHVVQALDAGRDIARNPVFDAMLVFERPPAPLPAASGVRVTPWMLEPAVSKLDLTFHFTRQATGLDMAIEYRTDLFDAGRIERLLSHIATLAGDLAVRGITVPVGRLAMIPEAECAQLAALADGGALPIPDGRIEALFAAQARAHPDRLAVMTAAGDLTYAALHARANAIAALLQAAGIQPGEPVLVMLDRGAALLAALLGILKAGGVYMPADQRHPPERIAAMLRRSRGRLAFAESAPPGMTERAAQDGLRLFTAAAPTPILLPGAAYLIFTSGSTGEPKGVVLGHAGFVNMIARQIEQFGVRACDRVVLFASPAFDASMSEIFMALLAGAAIVPADAAIVADAPGFPGFLRRQLVTVATLPPAYLAALGRPDLAPLRVLLTAGEPPVPSDLRHYAGRLDYFNAYGPTETSVCASIWRVPQAGPPDDDLPIGRPLANTAIHVLNAALQPVPIGVTGEICVAGLGLAQGYLDDPDATAKAFPLWRGERLYRTGDLGAWRADGQLSYSGRRDQQVKIRGQRVEPAEIERALVNLPGIAQALVLPRGEGPLERHLVAWLVRSGPGGVNGSALRAQLASVLPRAMVPAHFVRLDALPRTVNGKIDHRALPPPQPEADEPGTARTPTEAVVAAIFAQVLGRGAVDINAHFFDLGGDSIRLLHVAAALRQRGLAVDIAALYRAPTVVALAAALDPDAAEIDQSPVFGPAPLTAIQAWFFRSYRGNQSHFNQSVLLRPHQRLDPGALETAIAAMVRHHDALRLRIALHDGRLRQDFAAMPEGALTSVVDLRADPVPDAAMLRHAEQAQRSLDIAAGRMVAATLFQLPAHDALLLVIHHLVVDGVSWRILLDDLSTLLAGGAALPQRTHSVRDWAEHQARAASSPALAQERAHWAGVLQDQRATMPGPLQQRVSLTRTMPQDRLVDKAALELVLLAAFAKALSADGAPVVITVESHGREPIAAGLDVSRTVGWFTSLHPVRLDLAAHAMPDAVREAGRALADAPNRGAGFGLLSELAPDPVRLPKGGISFNYLGQIGAPEAGGIFTAAMGSLGAPVDPASGGLFAIDLLASLQEGGLVLNLSHDPAILPVAAAEAVMAAMQANVLAAGPAQRPAHTPVRPYIARVADDLPLMLHAGQPHVVAAMPPLFGYGAAFRALGEKLASVNFCAFDFIETEDRIERYVRAIRRRAAGRPVTVLGYSGGGNLGFEVAKALTAAGIAPAALILLDAPMKRRLIVQDAAAVQAMMTSNLEYFRNRMAADADYRAYVEQPELRAMMLRRMEAFIRYLDGHIDAGQIACDIHLLRSSQIWAEPDEWTGWAERTRGRLFTHQGSGIHAEMTDGCHLDVNAAIIGRLLDAAPSPQTESDPK